MILTVGVIPVAFYFPDAKPLFYDETVCEKLDFVSVHLYPKTGEVEKALKGLSFYEIGKPLIVEEIFPLEYTTADLDSFVAQSGKYTDGWIGFYWGATLQDNRRNKAASPYMIPWLEYFKKKSSELITAAP
ncbi:MAG TPA: hypothetical protein VK541_10940 [Pedobacter sp.]|uniref:hypothetical protein n=1 Tax=Pedobacter sp. TaxID=1411316 RepID=UPI002C6477CA|nr:hypothetical protein [Pedobacter sp.]HMI02990.1 hypothetical protein [Pedobacter sp.]